MSISKGKRINDILNNYSTEELLDFRKLVFENNFNSFLLTYGITLIDFYGEVIKYVVKGCYNNLFSDRDYKFFYEQIKKGSSPIDLLIVNQDFLEKFTDDFLVSCYMHKDKYFLEQLEHSIDEEALKFIQSDVNKKNKLYNGDFKSIPIKEFNNKNKSI